MEILLAEWSGLEMIYPGRFGGAVCGSVQEESGCGPGNRVWSEAGLWWDLRFCSSFDDSVVSRSSNA